MTVFDMGAEGAIEAVIVLALPLRIARTTLTLGMRRKLMVFPRIIGILAGAAAGMLLVIGLAAVSPITWRGLAALSAGALAAEAFQGRAAFGRKKRWPPGSLSLAPIGPWIDPDFYSNQAALHGPVFKTRNYVQPSVCIVDLQMAREMMRDSDAALIVPPLPFDRFVPGRFIRYLDPKPHRARSATVRAAISNDAVLAAEPFSAATVRNAMVELSAMPSATPWLSLERMVFRGFAHLFFGLESGTSGYNRFDAAMKTIDFRQSFRVFPGQLRRALQEVVDLLKTEKPQGFLRTLEAVDPEAAREPGILLNLLYVFHTSWTDVSGLMTWLMKILADHPEWLTQLREASNQNEVAERIVRETLRLSQSEYLSRFAKEDIEVSGYVIPKGWLVRVCIREIHRRSETFKDPLRFDPDRFLTEPPSAQIYAPFGASRVYCLGNDVTMMYGRLLALELARGYDLEVTADGPIEFGPFHWQPSRHFRVALTPRVSSLSGTA